MRPISQVIMTIEDKNKQDWRPLSQPASLFAFGLLSLTGYQPVFRVAQNIESVNRQLVPKISLGGGEGIRTLTGLVGNQLSLPVGLLPHQIIAFTRY